MENTGPHHSALTARSLAFLPSTAPSKPTIGSLKISLVSHRERGGGNGDLPNFQVLPPDLPIFAVVPPRTKPVVFISPPKEKLWALRQRGE